LANTRVMKVLVIYLLFTIAFVSYSQPDCSAIKGASGDTVDLSALVGRELVLQDSFSTYKTTICKNTYSDCGTCSGPAGFCQSTEFWADCIGVFSTIVGPLPGGGVELMYENGDWGAYGKIKLNCDPNAGDIDNLRPDGANYKIMIANSKHACFSSGSGLLGGLSGGSILLIILFVLAAVYVGAGIAWNFF